jgi:hypothetical protein
MSKKSKSSKPVSDAPYDPRIVQHRNDLLRCQKEQDAVQSKLILIEKRIYALETTYLEVLRGKGRGCFFCFAKMIYGSYIKIIVN